MYYHLWTIGCQMNDADSARAAEALQSLGLAPTTRAEDADLIILNTCVVRQSAEDKVIGRLDSLKSLKKRADPPFIVVMGCLVGDIPALRRRFPHVNEFLRPSDVEGLVRFVQERECVVPGTRPVSAGPAPVAAYVPIMYGCDHHCTYCIVRLRRGAGRSRPIAEIRDEIALLAARGTREVTLLGQNVDAYGRDLPDRPDLADLLYAICGIEGLWRVRFLTSHPAEMSERLIEAVAELPLVCEHFELPVQAGDDEVLRRMGRGYTAAQYRDLVGRIRQCIPGASIATDVIVGFPGESEAQFQRTYDLVEALRFDVVHIAAYSVRPGTPAAKLADDVPPEEKERRRRAIEELQTRIAGEINARLLGQEVEVLVEDRARGRWRGRTRTNKLVFFEDEGDWRGKLVPVHITWTGPWALIGRVRLPADKVAD
ncbi:MAG: tRNA (N6-isopentenyl adenosine(37)-C2)-methylthiotransferase MiaB [Chloroflexi bacterium]|nr:tRNA (N6-isopentenyl adenosine(37)-C2)-methylthiotransferase MiaB [Chloroflexota bacterium]